MRSKILGPLFSCALAATVVGCGSEIVDRVEGDDPEAHKLEVYNWLYIGSEKTAMDSLFTLLRERVPNIVFIGGQLYDPRDTPPMKELPQRIASGQPPDSFQAIGGQDLREWARNGALAPLDALAADQGWASVFPKAVLDSASTNGTLYGVPLDLERDNTLFFNKALFEANGVAPPTNMTTILDAAKAFEAKGIKALSVSASGGWTIASMLFDEVLLAEAGPDFHDAYVTGQLAGDAPEMQTALTSLATLMDYANPDRATTGWGKAVERLCTGEAAMLMMPNFVKSQLETLGCYGPDKIGYVPLEPPGVPTFVFVGIVFPLAKDALHPKNGIEFLKVVGSREGQDQFNRIKRTIPPRLDVDVSDFDYITVRETAEFRAPGTRLVLDYAAQTSGAFQETLNPVLQRFVDPASPDHKNVNGVLSFLRDNYTIIRP